MLRRLSLATLMLSLLTTPLRAQVPDDYAPSDEELGRAPILKGTVCSEGDHSNSKPVCADPHFRQVFDGYLTDYGTAAVGPAFNTAFNKPHWTVFVEPKGRYIVGFQGLISPALHDAAIAPLNAAITALITEPYNNLATVRGTLIVRKLAARHPELLLDPGLAAYASAMGCHTFKAGDDATRYLDDACPAIPTTAKTIALMASFGHHALMAEWLPGTLVDVQFMLLPATGTFKVAFLDSPAWKDLNLNVILTPILN